MVVVETADTLQEHLEMRAVDSTVELVGDAWKLTAEDRGWIDG